MGRSRKVRYLTDIVGTISYFQKEMNKTSHLGHVLNVTVYKTLSVHYPLSASTQHCGVEIITAPCAGDANVETHELKRTGQGHAKRRAANPTVPWVFPPPVDPRDESVCPMGLNRPACFSQSPPLLPARPRKKLRAPSVQLQALPAKPRNKADIVRCVNTVANDSDLCPTCELLITNSPPAV